jgi:hypothetical protein
MQAGLVRGLRRQGWRRVDRARPNGNSRSPLPLPQSTERFTVVACKLRPFVVLAFFIISSFLCSHCFVYSFLCFLISLIHAPPPWLASPTPQELAHVFGGKVERGDKREYGKADVQAHSGK